MICMDEIVLNGTAFEIGRQHGFYLKEEIHKFLHVNFAEIDTVGKCTKDVSAYSEIIKAWYPDFYMEIRGISEGAAISMEQAVLLQIRREVVGTLSYTLMGDCSSVAAFNDGDSIIAQTIDLNGDMTEFGHVYRIRKSGMPEILQYSFAGLLGYMGMNDAGLAVAINLIVSAGWNVGVPPYLIARKFLECNSIDECLTTLENLPLASSRSFLITDKTQLINLEITPNSFRVLKGKYLSHTNHMLHDDLKQLDKLNIFSKNSSIVRKQRLDHYVSQSRDQSTIKRAFKDHSLYPVGICAHNEGNNQLSETVAAVIMHPLKKEFWALKGKPCQKDYKLYKLQ